MSASFFVKPSVDVDDNHIAENRYYDCVIVGGGAIGLACALALSKAGFSIKLLGFCEKPIDDERSAALFPPSLTFLYDLGIEDELKEQGIPLNEIHIFDHTGSIFRAPDIKFKASEIGQANFGLNIPNVEIIKILNKIVAKNPLIKTSSALFEGYTKEDHNLRVRIFEEEHVLTSLLIGADGQNSSVRRAACIGSHTKPYPQFALTTKLSHKKAHNNISLEFHTKEGPFTFVPLKGDAIKDERSALVWLMSEEKAKARLSLSPQKLATEIMQLSMFALGEIVVEKPATIVPMRKMRVDNLIAPHVALVGEAAHAFPPIGAQGMNMGIKDLSVLVELLIEAKTKSISSNKAWRLHEVLPIYESRRKFDISARTVGVDLFNSALLEKSFCLDFLRSAGIAILKNCTPLRQQIMKAGGGFGS